jgi:hypothetical protein
VSAARPPLSVVIATTQPWPEIRATLDSLLPQARALGAEVIVGDGDGRGLPDPPALPEVVRIEEPGASVFRLRALGRAAARGDVVAITEDHCRLRDDWCRAVVEAHRRHPDADVIGGVVENGATGSPIDWAQFLVANGPFMPPVPAGAPRRLPGQANLSYKRRALPPDPLGRGVLETFHNQPAATAGRMVVDDTLVVEHVQSVGLLGSCALNYHNGRSIAGFRLAHMSGRERLARLAGVVVLPAYMLARTLAAVVPKGRHLGAVLASLPFLCLFLCCHAAGEAVGYVAGPGASPARLA